jgi:hypothetical protein
MTQHMAEPGPGVKGWDTSLVIDCTPAQHAQLQELITADLSSDCTGPRPELGQGIALEGLPSWDFGFYQSERSNKLIGDGTGTGTLERACVVGGRASVETNGEQMQTRNGGLVGGLVGGRTDSKPETKKAKKCHPNPENEDGLNTR